MGLRWVHPCGMCTMSPWCCSTTCNTKTCHSCANRWYIRQCSTSTMAPCKLQIFAVHLHLHNVITKHSDIAGCTWDLVILTLLSSQSVMFTEYPGRDDRGDTFEQAVLKLLNRYKDGHKLECKETRNAHEWSTPIDFMKAMAEGLSLTTDRFESPMNFSPYLEKYYSKYKEDQLFGANCDAHSSRWTGTSLAIPATDAAQADKAVRWAIASATQSQEPVLIALMLPWEGNTGSAYSQWLSHPKVQEIKIIKRTHIVLEHPHKDTQAQCSRIMTKWDVSVISCQLTHKEIMRI